MSMEQLVEAVRGLMDDGGVHTVEALVDAMQHNNRYLVTVGDARNVAARLVYVGELHALGADRFIKAV